MPLRSVDLSELFYSQYVSVDVKTATNTVMSAFSLEVYFHLGHLLFIDRESCRLLHRGFFRLILSLIVLNQAPESFIFKLLRLPAKDFWSNVTDRPLQRRNNRE